MGDPIHNVINWFIGLATLTSSLMVIYGGAKYILARGNKEKGSKNDTIAIQQFSNLFLFISLA